MNLPIIEEACLWVSSATGTTLDISKTQQGLSFLLYWSLLESRYMEGKRKDKEVLGVVKLVEMAKKIDSLMSDEVIDNAYNFFAKIYFPDGCEDRRFAKLRMETDSKPKLNGCSEKSFTAGKMKSNSVNKFDKLTCLLLIIRRYRNNLFHGLKSPTILDKFNREFSVINNLLQDIIAIIIRDKITTD